MTLREMLKNETVILDGGMGTLLQKSGLPVGTPPERWSLTHADEITRIHCSYFDAGCNVVATNTFGVNTMKYSRADAEAYVKAASACALRARAESKSDRAKFIVLDIGPLGRLLKPLGDCDFEDAVAAFSFVVKVGAASGVDGVLIETMNDSLETKAALLAVKENCDLPVLVSNAYAEGGRLLNGSSPAEMVAMLEGMKADAIGVNCSLGPKALAPVVSEYLRLSSLPVLCKPNAGLPHVENGTAVYDVSAEDFAAEMAAFARDGVRVMGGCCGTTPEYISALSAAVKEIPAKPICAKKRTVVSSAVKTVDFDSAPVLIGERINPTGKKRLKEALAANDMSYILNEGIKQAELGAHVLDVNVGSPDIDEKELLPSVVTELQAVCDLPLQIDTSDPAAMEAAMRLYNGKPLVNSVSGKAESMSAVFPLVRKYGGVVIALTLDENGIPDSSKERLKIAEKIIETAKEYGIDKNDIVFDPLTLSVSADDNAAAVTLDALAGIKKDLGCHTSLGVSNVSFGLPGRSGINAVFFTMALENGLSAAIMNPNSAEMMNAYYAWRMLRAKDGKCLDYIAFASANEQQPSVTAVSSAASCEVNTLSDAVIRGMKELAAAKGRELIASCDPMTLIQSEIIPALNKVGVDFEAKRVFLPQLLMSAEAAGAAFDEIKSAVRVSDDAASGCAVVLATVKGDIHDIGKNIVRLLLENYGFCVTDLGRDVVPEAIVDAVVRLNAPLVGLSALMTTTVPAMQETIDLIHKKAPFAKVIVGGAVLTEDYAKRIGADFYAKDAMETVRIAQAI